MTPLENHMAKPFINKRGLRAAYTLPLRQIILDVCYKHGTTILALKGERRTDCLTLARQEAAWECAHQTSASIAKIARELNRDPSTISYSIQRHQQRVDEALRPKLKLRVVK